MVICCFQILGVDYQVIFPVAICDGLNSYMTGLPGLYRRGMGGGNLLSSGADGQEYVVSTTHSYIKGRLETRTRG